MYMIHLVSMLCPQANLQFNEQSNSEITVKIIAINGLVIDNCREIIYYLLYVNTCISFLQFFKVSR